MVGKILLILALSTALLAPKGRINAQPNPVPAPTEVFHSWSHTHLASVTTGLDANQKDVQHRLYLLAVSTQTLKVKLMAKRKDDDLEACMADVLPEAAEQLREVLSQLRYPSVPATEKDPAKKASQARDYVLTADAPTNAALLGTIGGFRKHFEKSCSRLQGDILADDIQLALVDRVCVNDGPGCPRIDPPRNRKSDDIVEMIYARVAKWILLRRGNEDWKSNVVWIIDDANPEANVQTVVELSGERSDWPSGRDQNTAQSELARLVVRTRSNEARGSKNLIAEVVPGLVQIKRADFAKFADVVANPIGAQVFLASRPTLATQADLDVDDEPTRRRIKECSRFLNSNDFLAASAGRDVTANLTAVSGCAGIVLGGDNLVKARTLFDCLLDKPCKPKLADTVELRAAAGQAALPRLRAFAKDVDLERRGRECGLAQRALGDAASMDAASECLLSATTTEVQEIFACSKKKELSEKAKLECMVKVRTPSTAAAECILDNTKSEADRVRCALLAAPPPTLALTIGCRTNPDPQKCLTDKLGEAMASKLISALPPGAQKAAECYVRTKDPLETAGCVFGGNLPDEIAVGLQCASTGSAISAATCMIGSNKSVPKDVQKAAMCLASSQGNPLGAGVCMVSDSLTAEQRIAMQCAVTTGAVPAAFATCTLGQLALKELSQCANSKFAEGQCFGTNNEIRKLLRALNIDIGPNSVVASLANAYLVPVKVIVVFVQSPEQGLRMAAQEVSNAVARASSDVGDGIQHVGKEVTKLLDVKGNGEIAKALRVVPNIKLW